MVADSTCLQARKTQPTTAYSKRNSNVDTRKDGNRSEGRVHDRWQMWKAILRIGPAVTASHSSYCPCRKYATGAQSRRLRLSMTDDNDVHIALCVIRLSQSSQPDRSGIRSSPQFGHIRSRR